MTRQQEYLKRWYRKNRDRLLAAANARAKTPERKKQLHEAYRKRYSNPEYRLKILAANAAWFAAHPKASVVASRMWRARNREKARAMEKAWRKSEAGRLWHKNHDQIKRATKLNATVNPGGILTFIAKVRATKAVRCYYCEKPFSGKSVHFDHIIPLSKGGAHSIENLCVSCPHCNQTKFNKPIQEWMRLGQQILAL